jgi:hypothetical protein
MLTVRPRSRHIPLIILRIFRGRRAEERFEVSIQMFKRRLQLVIVLRSGSLFVSPSNAIVLDGRLIVPRIRSGDDVRYNRINQVGCVSGEIKLIHSFSKTRAVDYRSLNSHLLHCFPALNA